PALAQRHARGRKHNDGGTVLEPAHLLALGQLSVAVDTVRPPVAQVQPHIEEPQPDTGNQDGRDGYQCDQMTAAAQAALDGRPLVLAEETLDALEGDGVDVPGVARNVGHPLHPKVLRSVESVVHAGRQAEGHIRAIAITGCQLRIPEEIHDRVRKTLRLQYGPIEHAARSTDDSVA